MCRGSDTVGHCAQVYPPSLAPKQVSATTKHVKYVKTLEQENREVRGEVMPCS